MLHQSPCSVPALGGRSDAVPREQRARRPHQHALAPKRDRDLEHRAGEQRDEDLRDREVEVERRLPEDLERDDDAREVQARIAERRQQHGIRGAADPHRRPPRGEGRRAHRAGGGATLIGRPWYGEFAPLGGPEFLERRGVAREREHLLDEAVLDPEQEHLVEVERAARALPGGAVERRRPLVARRARRSAATRTSRPSPSEGSRGSGRSGRGRGTCRP